MRLLGQFNKLVSQFYQSYYFFGFVQAFYKKEKATRRWLKSSRDLN